MSEHCLIKKNTPELRKKLEDAGLSVCICTTFEDADWLSCWGSHSDNMNDVPKEVRMKAASNANKKYSDELVEAIKHDKTSGMSYKDLMAKYNISSKGTISYIINKR